MSPSTSGSRVTWRRALPGALTAGLLLAFLITLPPHLVHHLFEEDHVTPDCPYFAQSQQVPGLLTDPPVLAPPTASDTLAVLLPEASLPSSDPAGSHPRAPPCSAPSV